MAIKIICKECGTVLDCEDEMKDQEITCSNCKKIANPAPAPAPAPEQTPAPAPAPAPAEQENDRCTRVIEPPPEEKRLKFKAKKTADALYDPAMFPRPRAPKVSVLAIALIVFGILSTLAFLFNLLFVINNLAGIKALFANMQSDASAVQNATMMFLLVINTAITFFGAIAMWLLAAALWKNQKAAHTAATAAVTAEEALFVAKMTMDK